MDERFRFVARLLDGERMAGGSEYLTRTRAEAAGLRRGVRRSVDCRHLFVQAGRR
jgi:hypothetical protein